MSHLRVLAINSYAGSLLQAATNLGLPVTMSLEDAGFGSGIAAANFPEITHVEKVSLWPATQDLSNTVVIAHPPCSYASIQNSVASAKGVDSEAFKCTARVLEYSMSNGAVGVAVESVLGALPTAWRVHQDFADHYGYHLYRILQNGCMFGCQWRERFWVVYVKKGAAHRTFALTLTPRYQTVSDVITGFEDGPAAGNQDALLARQKAKLVTMAGCSEQDMRYLFEPPPHHPTKALGTILYDYKFKKEGDGPDARTDVFEKYVGTFTSGTMVYLDPLGLAPVLMGGSFWYVNGRCLSERGFKRVMGYPADYQFPTERRNYRTQMRMFLSKGVMPPVAEWVLEQLTHHLGWRGHARRSTDASLPAYQLVIEPNLIADFRIKKQDWYQRDQGLPPLRSDEEGIIRAMIIPPRDQVLNPRPVAIDEPEERMSDEDPVVEDEPITDQTAIELADVNEERARMTRERYAKKLRSVSNGPAPTRAVARDTPAWLFNKIRTLFKKLTDVNGREPAPVTGPPAPIVKIPRPQRVASEDRIASLALVDMKPLEITTRRLRGRWLEITPGAVLDVKANRVAERRRAEVFIVLTKHNQLNFDELVRLARQQPHMSQICEATALDIVRDMVRDHQLREAAR